MTLKNIFKEFEGTIVGLGYKTPEVTKALKINRSTFQVWFDRGWIPVTKKPKGHGDPAEFSIGDVYAIQAFKMLIDSGIKRDFAALCARTLALRFNLSLEHGVDDPKLKSKHCWFDIFLKDGKYNSRISASPKEDGRQGKEYKNQSLQVSINISALREFVDNALKTS